MLIWARLRASHLKTKSMSRFCSSLRKRDYDKSTSKHATMGGATKVAHAGKGNISVPTAGITKVAKKHYKVVMVQEHSTSKTCTDCNTGLMHVVDATVGWEVRDLKRCSNYCKSTVCSQIKLKNRDVNAALNVRKCDMDILSGAPRDLAFTSSRKVKIRGFLMHSEFGFRKKKNNARNCMNK